MIKKCFKITICSHPDKENLVAEISCKIEKFTDVSVLSYKSGEIADVSTQNAPHYIGWAQISAEKPHEYAVCFCNNDDGNYWEFSYDEAMEALKEAKNRLSKYQRTPEEQSEYDTMKK